MDQRFEHVDLELLLGDGVQANWFHDNRLGRALDHIDKAGTDTLLSEVVVRYLNREDVGPFSVHLDHTSVSVYGAYDTDQQPTPAHGHSKDHRPDLKQLVVSPPVPPEARPSRPALPCRHDLGPPHPPLSPARAAGPAQLRAAARPRRPRV
jgi:hypothetical protein